MGRRLWKTEHRKRKWNIADIFNALMAIPNLIALLALSKVIVKETKAFTEKLNVEEKNQRILKGMNAENV